eukprot:5044976-Amphidinium_carterae.1
MRRSTCRRLTRALWVAGDPPTPLAQHEGYQKPWAKASTPCWIESDSSNLPTVEEEEACDAFGTKAWNLPDFELHANNGRTVYTRTLRPVSAQLSRSARSERKVPSQNGVDAALVGLGGTLSASLPAQIPHSVRRSQTTSSCDDCEGGTRCLSARDP